MSEALQAVPAAGWTVGDLDRLPGSGYRYEPTDGALSVTPSPSNLHLRRHAGRLDVDEPFEAHPALAEPLPRWAR